MAIPLSVQLYSLREYSEKNGLASVLQKVAEIGYKGVEPAGFYELRPREFKKMADDLGLKIYSSHTPWVTPDNWSMAMDLADDLGMDCLVCGFVPDNFKDLDSIKWTAEKYNKVCENLNRNGYQLFLHNHHFEFNRMGEDNRLKYEIFTELCPNLKLEVDVFWAANLGKENPVDIVKKFASRMILVHIKDGYFQNVPPEGVPGWGADQYVEMTPLGKGTMPIPEIVAAAPKDLKAIVVELDKCNIDMMKAIELSYQFMTKNGLAEGNK